MRWLGILLGAVSLLLAGNSLALRLREETAQLRKVQKLLVRVRREIDVRRLPTGVLLRELADDPDYAKFPFLRETSRRFTGVSPPAAIWTEELARWKGLKRFPESREILKELGGILGSADGESQAAALLLLEERLNRLLAAAEEKSAADGRLCRSLGALAGLLLAVLAI